MFEPRAIGAWLHRRLNLCLGRPRHRSRHRPCPNRWKTPNDAMSYLLLINPSGKIEISLAYNPCIMQGTLGVGTTKLTAYVIVNCEARTKWRKQTPNSKIICVGSIRNVVLPGTSQPIHDNWRTVSLLWSAASTSSPNTTCVLRSRSWSVTPRSTVCSTMAASVSLRQKARTRLDSLAFRPLAARNEVFADYKTAKFKQQNVKHEPRTS